MPHSCDLLSEMATGETHHRVGESTKMPTFSPEGREAVPIAEASGRMLSDGTSRWSSLPTSPFVDSYIKALNSVRRLFQSPPNQTRIKIGFSHLMAPR